MRRTLVPAIAISAALLQVIPGYAADTDIAEIPAITLPPVDQPGASYAWGVTDTGIVVGFSSDNLATYWMPVRSGEGLTYTPHLLGSGDAYPTDVSGNGLAVGTTTLFRPRATLWRISEDGSVETTDLDQFAADSSGSYASAVNDSGMVAGLLTQPTRDVPAIWTPSPTGGFDVQLLPGSLSEQYEIWGMNDSGWVVGAANHFDESVSRDVQDAVLWRPSAGGYELVRLPKNNCAYYGNAYDVNDAGEIVGESCRMVAGQPQVILALWSVDADENWTLVDMGPSDTSPSDINDDGRIVGVAQGSTGELLPTLYTPFPDGSFRTVGLSTPGRGQVSAISDSGYVVGIGREPQTALVWVLSSLAGFDSPVDMGAVFNVTKAGSTVPLRWTMTDASEAPNSGLESVDVAWSRVPCPTDATTSFVEETVSSPGTLMNLGNGKYQLNWRSPRHLAGACLVLSVGTAQYGAGYLQTFFRLR